jgi:hypothetical protein
MRRNIFARIHQRQNSSYIEVFDWKLSTCSSHCKAIIFPGVMIVCLPIGAPLFVADIQIIRTGYAFFQVIDFWHFLRNT